ncbi:unnamed protein product (macronuclear) [Paramecium tetraurelia]|uniref:Uncharacterized protein n=1 Tax=Paramecium tetraurelia TaxID=5888 RepID=A0CAG1_PARTE|nr:uncharacterized protein GSPATT00036558001 [Paramecium tetraurelia]CAK67778.1 unnamed protein product [Paramecium tetraurelia]|eukprot:XP_001435175.1 hypothetical protein (macronuclear) [Paramecium tetraurelia strain d4-2]
MSLDRMRKSLQSLLGIQSNPQNEQPSQVSKQSQPQQVLRTSDQIFKNKFVIIQKKEDKLNPYKYALERLKEYNLTMLRANDLLKCPIISYKFNKEEKRIHENIVTKPRWKKEESSQEIINIKPEDDRKSFFFHASYTKDENPQPSQSKQTAKKSQVSLRNSDSYGEYNFEKEKQTVENILKSNKQKAQEEDNQSESDSIVIIDKKSEPKFRKLNPPPQELNKDPKQISGKKETQNADDIQTSKKPTVQKYDVQEKLPERQVPQEYPTNPTTEIQKNEVVENKQPQAVEPQVEQKITPLISDQVQIAPDVNPFTQSVQNQLFTPPWLDNPISQQQQSQVSFNLFQQPLIQQQPQMQQPIMQPIQFQNPMQQQQTQNLFPFQNQQQSQNVFSSQNLFNQQPNLFQNNQQPQQNFNLFSQTNQFQQQPLFQQQQSQQPLFQQQPSSESFFQQQSSTQNLFQQQPLFQQQSSTQSFFQQQPSSNLFASQPQNQLFQQPNQQATNLFGNNDQRSSVVDLFSAQSVQNTPNLFQQNQTQNQESLFSLNTQSQSNNTAQQRAYSHSDRYKKNLSKYTTERIE